MTDTDALPDHADCSENRPDDFLSILTHQLYNFDWVFLLVVAISFLFISSDLFYTHVLSKYKSALDNRGDMTTYGYIIQLITMLLMAVFGKTLISVATYR